MICKHCGKENLEDSLYCIQCGMKLEEEKEEITYRKFCPGCGRDNIDNSSFCPICGADLKKETAPKPEFYNYQGTNNEYAPASNTSLICAIISSALSLLCCCFPFVTQIASIVLSIMAIVKGSSQMKSNNPGTGKAGFILGIISLILAVFILFFMIIGLVGIITDPELMDSFLESFNDTYGSQF